MKKGENPTIYVTRDRERASSIPENEAYSIISGDSLKDTFELLSDPKVREEIKEKKANVLVFKNNIQIEKYARKNGIKLLNPSAVLAEKIENKITQVAWLGDLAKLLPPHRIDLVKNIVWEKKPFIVQWSHSHTGDGTLLIQKEKDLEEIKNKFPNRDSRMTEFIKGPMFTVNSVVCSDKILVGNVSYQITGNLPFTENPFSTIGNDWSLTYSLLTENQVQEITKMTLLIGEKLKKDGWKGLFGLDVIYDEERDKISLIEINARQPASTTYESELQTILRSEGVPGITIFEAHLAALKNELVTGPLIEINDGAQIIQRVTSLTKKIDTSKLEQAGYKVIKYPNTKLNADLVRIQSLQGIMETHNKFNKRGKEIVELLG